MQEELKEKIKLHTINGGYNRRAIKDIRDLTSIQIFLSEYLGANFYAPPNTREGIESFLYRLSIILEGKKYDRFVSVYKNYAAEVYKTIIRELKGVFFGEDRFIKTFFSDERESLNFDILRSSLGETELMQGLIKEVVLSPNSVLYFEPSTFEPEQGEEITFKPVMVNPLDFYEKGKNIKYIKISISGGFVFMFDNLIVKTDTELNIKGAIEHTLNYVPAIFIGSKVLCDSIRKPFTYESTPSFFTLLEHENGRNYLEQFCSYPIMVMPEEKCEYTDGNGNYCVNGVIDVRTNTGFNAEGIEDYTTHSSNCPSCTNRGLLGPGTTIELPEEWDGATNPVTFINASTDALSYHKDRTDEIENRLLINLVGLTAEAFSKDAYNEVQVASMRENKQQILREFAHEIENVHKFVIDTFAKLYFNTFERSTVNYGSIFVVTPVNTLLSEYENLRQNGAPVFLLNGLLTQTISTKFRTNSIEQKRQMLLMELEPYVHFSGDFVLSLYEKGIIDRETLELKLNFSKIIGIFEVQEGPLELFGAGNDNKTQVKNNILSILKQIIKTNSIKKVE
jgi:hypothetical protein